MPSRSISDVIRNQAILTLPPGATVRQAALAMAERRVGSVLVVADDRLIGIFTERDALFRVLAAGLDPDTTPLASVMTGDPATIEADRKLVHALHLMHDNGFRHVPVVAHGRPVGVVSIRDALGEELVHFEREASLKQALSEAIR